MKKLLSLLLAIFVLSFCILPVTVCADENDWVISDDGETLTHGNTIYEKYELPVNVNYLPDGKVYLYDVESRAEEYFYDYVSVLPDNTDIVRLHHTEEVFVTEKGKVILDKFKNGEYSFYLYFADYSIVVDFAPEQFALFIKESNKTEVDVTEIWNDEIYEVRGFDETGTYAHNCGAVYEVDGEYYYIHYDSLDNTYFDAYGEFSYRKGIVPAYKLDETGVEFVKNAKFSSKARMEEYIYPDEVLFMDADDDLSAMITFWVIAVLVGLLIPAVPLVLSLKFAHSKKSLNPKKWYILTACSALWILAGVGMVLTFIL